MSSTQSNLSAAKYGYDYVVATTQASINATMKEYLAGLSEPVVTVCYVADADGNPTEIAYDEFLKQADGSDPFSVPADVKTATDPNVANLMKARFMMGFQAQLGLPPGLLPEEIPDIVVLKDNMTAIYNLLCSLFTVVELKPSYYGPPLWHSTSQPPGQPWIFTSQVDLMLSHITPENYPALPPDVLAQIHNLGAGAFSVQQLLFDLNNAALESMPTMSGLIPGSWMYDALQRSFLGAYFDTMKKNGEPLLGCSITKGDPPPSTLSLTGMNTEVSPFHGGTDRDLTTLNYLCAADGDPLPSPVAFDWNWIDEAEADAHGVVAINRTTFANYFKAQLMGHVLPNCYRPSVRVTYDAWKMTTSYQWSMPTYQTPEVSMPATGTNVLSFHLHNEAADQAGLNGDMGRMELKSTYDASVTFSGNTITIVQHLLIYLYVRSLQSSDSGNVVDKTITDTYTLKVGQDGNLVADVASSTKDDSKDPSPSGGFLNWFTGVDDITNDAKNWVRGVTATAFRDMPVSVVQDFIFPGGRTFAFKAPSFSSYGDLTAHITYTDPDPAGPLLTAAPLAAAHVSATHHPGRRTQPPRSRAQGGHR